MSGNFSPVIDYYTHIIINVIFSISITFFFFMVYLILTQSKNMSKYKYYLLNNILWAQIFEVFLFIFKPKFLLPSFCMLFDPFFLVTDQTPYLVYFALSMLVNQCLSVVLSALYRYAQVKFKVFFYVI